MLNKLNVSTAKNPILRDLQNKALEWAFRTDKTELEKIEFGFWLNNELENIYNQGISNDDAVDFNAIVKIMIDYILPNYNEEITIPE